jgi:hypothetical protein
MDDRVVAVNHQIDDLDLTVSGFSSRPADVEMPTRYNLSAQINGATLSLDGQTRPFGSARETQATIGLNSLQVPHYLPYLPLPDNLSIQSLTLETETKLDFRMQETGKPELILAGSILLLDARLADGNNDPFVHHPNLKLELLPSKVLAGELRLAKVETSSPEYFLKRLPSGELYMPFLAVRAYDEAEARAAEDITRQFRPVVTIDTFNLRQGVLHYSDLSNNDPFAMTLTDLTIDMDNFGLNSDRTAAYLMSVKTDADEFVRLSGSASLSPIQVAGDIVVSGLKVSRYVPYYQDVLAFKTVDGRLSIGGNYRFRQDKDGLLATLSNVTFDMDALKVVDADDDEHLITINRLRVADTTADWSRREVTVGSLELANATISCRRDKDGSLNLVEAFAPPTEARSPGSDDADVSAQAPALPTEPTKVPLVLNLKTVNLSTVAVEVEDRVPQVPVKFRMDDISLRASDLSTAPGATGQADLSLRWEQDGQVRVGGSVSIVPLVVDMAVTVGKLDIRPFQPYLSEQAGLIVTEGFFNAEGRMALSQKQMGPPVITYTGKAGLNRFASIDRKNANDFLKWEALLLDTIAVGVNPNRLSIEQVALSNFFARVIVAQDGSINLVSMFTDTETAGVEPSDTAISSMPQPAGKIPANKQRASVRIARITVNGGDVDFSDRFIKPNFNAKFHDLGGRISGLASIQETRADVLLEGMWSNHAPVTITGQINPLIQSPYMDLNLNIADIELSPFSPYSGKYLGYILEKGKLTFNVAYLLENRQLEGKNSVTIDQLTLGDTVDSPEAVSLPIKLAVALLKDRNGNIELDLPVSGSIDDPEFKIGTVVLTMLKNLIVKIVTSPFAALGGLAGGGEELSYLDFEAGASELSQANVEKMDKLAKILYERPALNLDVQGAAAPQWDSNALRARLLENRLKAQIIERMMKAGKSAVPLEVIVVSDAERPGLIETAFAESNIPVPVDESGTPLELTSQDKEKLLRTTIEVTENDYRQLANARAFNAKNYLLKKGQIERARIFIVEPQAGSKDEQQEDAGKGRVIFSLK